MDLFRKKIRRIHPDDAPQIKRRKAVWIMGMSIAEGFVNLQQVDEQVREGALAQLYDACVTMTNAVLPV